MTWADAKKALKWAMFIPALFAGWGTFIGAVYSIDNLMWLAKNADQVKEVVALVLHEHTEGPHEGMMEHDVYGIRATYIDHLMSGGLEKEIKEHR